MRRIGEAFRLYGPLRIIRGACRIGQSRLGRIPGAKQLFSVLNRCVYTVHGYLDGSFDRRHGTDTSGKIPLDQLTLCNDALGRAECTWYEPMSAKAFDQIMGRLSLNFGNFCFVDFGSGKGRVLLLAAKYGFRKIIGVEFAEELCHVAASNVEIYNVNAKARGQIDVFCMDARRFSIPDGPVMLFFYSPFTGSVMQEVLDNIATSFARSKRDIVIIFYGRNVETIAMLRATGFICKEMHLCLDCSRFIQYRCFLLMSSIE